MMMIIISTKAVIVMWLVIRVDKRNT